MDIRERATFWRDPQLDNLEVLHATYVTHSFAPHMHEGFVIGIVDSGVERFAYQKSFHDAPVGSIVLINPAEMHTGSAGIEQGWSYRCLYPAPSLLQRAASELTDKPHGIPFFSSAIIFDNELSIQLSTLHDTLAHSSAGLERESHLLWTFAQLVLRYADDHPSLRSLTQEDGAVRRVRTYIEDHYAEPISLEQLAQIAHLSQFHLLRVFREQVGLPPHAYLTYVRIQRAKRLLSARLSPIEVALSVGFADQSHFTKHFKRITGVPPGMFMRGIATR
jgi:AraC-like DNA-binding protein